MKNAIVLYMPVLHEGYINFIQSRKEGLHTIFLIHEALVKTVDQSMATTLERDLRAVDVEIIQEVLRSLMQSEKTSSVNVEILNKNNLSGFDTIFVPCDEITEKVLLTLYPTVSFVSETIFLRWNKWAIGRKTVAVPDTTISKEILDVHLMKQALTASENSSDFWRTVGCVLVPCESEQYNHQTIHQPIIRYNHHLPHAQSPYINGDARSNYNAGEALHVYTSVHGEASAIAEAARQGIVLQNASIYVTTFPCSNCARLIIESGISTVYFYEGYSTLDSLEILQSGNIKIIQVLFE